MKIENYKKRIADKKIEHYLKLFGAISIEGPKYCGKTWAGRYHSNSEILLQKTTVSLCFLILCYHSSIPNLQNISLVVSICLKFRFDLPKV